MPTTNTKTRTYWFPAKRYGWGWGPPTAWQGWLVVVVFFMLVIGGAARLLPRHEEVKFALYTALLSALLVVVCWITGEPPRWRWGGK